MAKEKLILNKEDFEFVQMNEKIFDKKFETKAIGYFGDAFRRFCKNKSSVVAFIMLMFIILMSIFVPAISKKDPMLQDPLKMYLPPRIPGLENIGVADGIKTITGVQTKYIISKDDPIINILSSVDNDKTEDIDEDIDNYYFIEYITNFSSLDEVNAAAYDKTFDNEVRQCVDIEYHLYHALDRPRWVDSVEYNQYVKYQEYGIIRKDAEGKELVRPNDASARNLLITFTKQYNNENGVRLLPDNPIITQAYYETYGVTVEEMFKVNTNYTILIEAGLNPETSNEKLYHLFGTDGSGRDLWVRLWKGTRLSLLIGLFVATVSIVVGVIWGAISGYYGGVVDLAMERFTEILTGIPWIVIMTITKMLLRGRVDDTIIVAISLVLTSWTGTAGMVRSQMYRYKNREYVLASRTLGAKDPRLIFKHILPNALGTIVTSCVLVIPSAIFFESSVAYLGLGIDATVISVGNILSAGRESGIVEYPYLTLFPAVLISILMISFNMFGNGLRDALNPSLRGSE